jgi:ubiquinone/menaquinone biosynthesis C-methylase UbiE
METKQSPNREQTELWNGTAGQAWVKSQHLLDGMLQPFADLLVERVSEQPATRVLDVGCGTGAVTLALARRLGSRAHCTGVDISEPMLGLARARAEHEPHPPSFILADAQSHAFAPGGFDTLVSRFGVMFFEEPARAFANLRGALRASGRLACLTWRSAADNPFMTAAESAAAPLLPNLPARRPEEPGQFAFSDAQRVRRILEEGGWKQIELEPVDRPCSLPVQNLDEYVTRLGPVGRVLQSADEDLRARVLTTVQGAFAPYIHDSEVRFNGACWLVQARA